MAFELLESEVVQAVHPSQWWYLIPAIYFWWLSSILSGPTRKQDKDQEGEEKDCG